MDKKIYLGIGIGSSRVKIVTGLDGFLAPEVRLREHLGNPREAVLALLEGIDPASVAGMSVTGGDGAALIAGQKVYECEAIEESLRMLNLKVDSILSLGGESFAAFPIDSMGRVTDYLAGNKCAAGTVEFFKQQLGRMGLTIEEGTRLAAEGKVVPLAKRCSVHCKSDCTHALNKSRCSIADIVHTLCHNMAEKSVGLLHAGGIAKGRVLVIGGASSNPVIVGYIRKFLPGCDVQVPDHATYFEALGAASLARTRSLPLPKTWNDIFAAQTVSFNKLEPLKNFEHLVTILPPRRGKPVAGRKYLLGIDGGSTTTKAALVDFETLETCASRYVRTSGNPERAMKECLRDVRDDVLAATGGAGIRIVGVATTGSSGEILSVLCGTPAYHNEIIAHACGAAHYCPDVDTIFEVGGQDSKFTSLRAGVPVDFSMNESCSAGTGSFIEESAKEDLGIPMERISELALASLHPPSFSDQCAAFANTDIRKAFQEGASKEDNLAGLVYAIAENYISKVVGERRIGKQVFFQGGTSKNKAIACAFAAKTGKPVVVPPDSELIGCFGIALWLKEKIVSGVFPEGDYRLDALLERSASDRVDFTCKACENFCTIQNLTIEGHKYPFGGQCSKWENARNKVNIETSELDLVAKRNRMMFEEFGVAPGSRTAAAGLPVIGLQGVFSVYAFYPLYSWFFTELGHPIEFSEKVDPHGVRMCQSNRCYPYEIAHGTFYDLVKKDVKKIFSPHVVSLPRDDETIPSLACPIAQAAPYYLSAAFKSNNIEILDPVLDMSDGLRSAEKSFVDLAVRLGHSPAEGARAFCRGCDMQEAFERKLQEEGQAALERLERENLLGVVIIGRPYNAFAKIANMGIPRKFASRGVMVLPFEFLPLEGESVEQTMYWKYGQVILKAIKYTKRHPRLFPVYISNFGCGPDSFIQHFAVSIMARKPMLYLELDSHTADAGIGTRAAAFLDIVGGFRKLASSTEPDSGFRQAEFISKRGTSYVLSSGGELVPAKSARVTLAYPSMGRLRTEAGAATSRSIGYNAIALPPVDEKCRAIGKTLTSGKECSPVSFTIGSLVNHYREKHKREREDEILLFFMPTATGPCRFGQYNVLMKRLINDLEMEDVAIFSPSPADGYGNLGWNFMRAAWQSFVISDLMQDVEAVLKVAAKDPASAAALFETEWKKLNHAMALGYANTWKALGRTAAALSTIPLRMNPRDVPKVLLTGEIYVRSDDLSRRGIENYYAEHGLMLKTADSIEWIYYTDWLYLSRLAGHDGFPKDFLGKEFLRSKLRKAILNGDRTARTFVFARLKLMYEQSVERKARRILGGSGLLTTSAHNIDKVVRAGSEFVRPALAGEAILTVGATSLVFEHPEERYCGAIFIGPFNCMPTGVAESVIKPHVRAKGIPYLTFETDGGPLAPNFKSQMEVHILRCSMYASHLSV